VLVTLGLAARATAAPESQPAPPESAEARLGPPAPTVDALDQGYLTNLVRQVMIRRISDAEDYQPAYVPEPLKALRCAAAISLRDAGRLVATADTEILPVVQACSAAALTALAAAGRERPLREADLARLTIELELLGPMERVGTGVDLPEQLSRCYEPAIHGIGVRFDGKQIVARPSQLISVETLCRPDGGLDHYCDRYAIAIDSFQEKLGLGKKPPDRSPESVVFFRFRTTHWYEPKPLATPVELIGGLRWIDPEELTRERLLETVDDLARYIRHRQSSDGQFSYEFLPGQNIYWPKDQNWVRQAATMWALAVHARHRDDSESAQALERAIAAFARWARPLSGTDRASFIATPDGRHPLGVTALVCLALIDAPSRDRHAELRAALLNAIAAAQRPDGSFRTSFPPSTETTSQDYAPGEALLAVAREYALTREGRWRALCDKSLDFYVAYWREKRPPMFVPWQAQAFGQMARATRLRKYADYVYEMSDAIAGMMIEPERAPSPIYQGALDVYGLGYGGISTAVYVEGLVEAARVAREFGDVERAKRYSELVRQASRFVMQLRFREEECYYVQSPQDVIGGVRNTPADPTLRIDHAQHALAALLGAAELLGGGTEP